MKGSGVGHTKKRATDDIVILVHAFQYVSCVVYVQGQGLVLQVILLQYRMHAVTYPLQCCPTVRMEVVEQASLQEEPPGSGINHCDCTAAG